MIQLSIIVRKYEKYADSHTFHKLHQLFDAMNFLIFGKCWKLCASISEKCWKFIASKMLEIESQYLTWVGPKCMYLSSRSRNLSIACKMATCWKIAFFIYMYVCSLCTYLGYGQGQATRVWRKKMHSDHWNFWMGLYFWNAAVMWL